MNAADDKVRDVVVGVDGTEGSILALKWALDRKGRFGAVRTVTAFHIGPFGDGFGVAAMASPGIQIYEEAAEARLEKALAATDPSLRDTATIVESSAGPGLVHAAEDAGLLVVGCRGRSGLAERLLGSVGSYCVKHAPIPVAVIAGDSPLRPLETIAVGIDGSENCKAALRWAIDHVDPGGTIVAVGSFNPLAYSIDGYVPPMDLLEGETLKNVEDSVAEVLAEVKTDVTIRTEVRVGDPRTVLREASEEFDLLVVGSRGHRGVAHLLLGSVTTSLLHHPTGAIVVVPYNS